MAILRLKTHIFALAYSVFFFYSFHVDFQNLHEFHVDFFKTLTVEFYMKTVEKKSMAHIGLICSEFVFIDQ